MAETKIQWSQRVWNPVSGCAAISPGCKLCYAATMTRRLDAMGQKDYAGLTTAKHFNGTVRCLPHKLDIPLKRRKPTTYFVNSMSDLFHEDVPDEFINQIFAVMAMCPQHTFQVLTKRAERMATALPRLFGGPKSHARWPAGWWHRRDANDFLPNVWLGVSCEDQQRADERIPWLLDTPAAVRFISAEPLLGPIDLELPLGIADTVTASPFLDWLIDGGESGPHAREYRLEWSLSLQEQCAAAGVPYFRKQLGSLPLVDYYSDSETLREWALSKPHELWDPAGGGKYAVLADRDRYQPPPKTLIRVKLQHKKGGDDSEWPEDLRVRQMPLEAV